MLYFLFLIFPEFMLGAQFIKTLIRAVSAGHELPSPECLGYGTARLFEMSAVIEPAFSYVGLKIYKIILELLLGYNLHHLYLK